MKCCCLPSTIWTVHELHADIDWQVSAFIWHTCWQRPEGFSKFVCHLALREHHITAELVLLWHCITQPLDPNPGGGLPGNEKHFCVSWMLQCCRKFMKMLFCELFLTRARWQSTPGIHCNGLRDKSVDPTQETGWAVRTLILITSASFSHLFFAEGLRSRCWKHGTINDLHYFAFNKLWQTTPSVPQDPRLTCFPGFHLCCAFEPDLKAATLKQTRPRGSPTPDRMGSNSANSFIQTNQVAPLLLHGALLVTFQSRNHNFVAVFSLCSCQDQSK